jgi:uncharacterized peroxidase-related enzyme
MSLIDMTAPEDAQGETAEIYAQIKQAFGNVPNVLKVWSASPFLLRQQWEFISYAMQHPSLSGPLLACIRLLVSRSNHCSYCVDMNTGFLINLYGWGPGEVEAMIDNPTQANLPHRELAMLGLVLKTVIHSTGITAADISHLKEQGYTDQDILDAVAHGARMTAADIVINAFKVEKDF